MNYLRFFNAVAQQREGSILRTLYRTQRSGEEGYAYLNNGSPNPNTFPFVSGCFALRDGSSLTLNSDLMAEALQYGNSDGYDPLVLQLKSLTKRLHSPPLWPETSLIVTVGCQDGLCKAIEMMISPGDFVIVEEPCYSGTLAILQPFTPRFLSVAGDEEGMRPDLLKTALSSWNPVTVRDATENVPKFLYTNPNGCNPSGAVLSEARRHEIYAIACQYNLIILEDDPYYFIQFSEESFPPSFLSLDTEGRVLRFDSFSKTMSAGIRLGYVTGPSPLVEKILWHQQVSVSHAPVLSQVLVSELLKKWGEEGFLKHTEKIRELYRHHRDVALSLAEKHLSGLCEWSVPAGGMFLWIKVRGVKDTLQLALEGGNHKVVTVAGMSFMPDPEKPSQFIRISYSVPLETLEFGIQRLANLIREYC